MHLLACSVLCVFLGCLISIDAASFGPNLDFLKDPDFPGNAGWQKKLDQRLSYLKDPDFPGNPGWQKKLQESLASKNNQIISGNTGTQKTVSNIPSSTNNQIISGTTETEKTVTKISSSTNVPKYSGNTGSDSKNFKVRVPHFPKNFPFPPECHTTDYPGFPYPGMNKVSSSNVEQTIEHESLMCSDPEFSPESFYMLKIIANRGPYGKNSLILYYNKKGEVIYYAPKVEFKLVGA